MGILSMRSHREGLVNGLVELISKLPNDIIVAEIGSYSGESSEIFMTSGKIKELHCIDAWTQGYDDNDIASRSNLSDAEAAFDDRMKDYLGVTKHKGWSYDVVNDFPDGYFDFIYIDSTHTYDGVMDDIKLYTPKLKKGGRIGGHDYSDAFPGVRQAVDEVYYAPDFIFEDSSWLVFGT